MARPSGAADVAAVERTVECLRFGTPSWLTEPLPFYIKSILRPRLGQLLSHWSE